MARYQCRTCNAEFPTRHGREQHQLAKHRTLRPPPRTDRTQYCPALSGEFIHTCDKGLSAHEKFHLAQTYGPNGQLRHPSLGPPPRPNAHDWSPFEDQSSFEVATFEFVKRESSAGDIDEMLRLWSERSIAVTGQDTAPYKDHKHMYNVIDDISLGGASWSSYEINLSGDIDGHDDEPWARVSYILHAQDTLQVARGMLDNPDFDGHYDTRAYRRHIKNSSGKWERELSDVMSGQWAWRQSVSHDNLWSVELGNDQSSQEEIAADPDIDSDGATFVGIAAGMDKTTVSVGTGDNEFWPVYFTLTGIHNDMRRAHQDALVPVAFLSIPKSKL
jgi:hypothetical protein